MILMGLIGEYVGRLYLLNNCIPQYVIRTVVGVSPHDCDSAHGNQEAK